MLSNDVFKVFPLLCVNDYISKLLLWLDSVSLIDDADVDIYLQIDIDRVFRYWKQLACSTTSLLLILL